MTTLGVSIYIHFSLLNTSVTIGMVNKLCSLFANWCFVRWLILWPVYIYFKQVKSRAASCEVPEPIGRSRSLLLFLYGELYQFQYFKTEAVNLFNYSILSASRSSIRYRRYAALLQWSKNGKQINNGRAIESTVAIFVLMRWNWLQISPCQLIDYNSTFLTNITSMCLFVYLLKQILFYVSDPLYLLNLTP